MPEYPPFNERDESVLTLIKYLPLISLLSLLTVTGYFLQDEQTEIFKSIIALCAIACSFISLILSLLIFKACRQARTFKLIAILYIILFCLGQLFLISGIITTYNNTHLTFAKMGKKIDIAEYMASTKNTIDDKVKTAVIFAWGDKNPDITNVKNDKKMSDYGLNQGQIFFLTDYLNIAVAAGNDKATPLSATDVSGAAAIQDCIDLVNKAIKPVAP